MGTAVTPFTGPRELAGLARRPPVFFLPTAQAAERFWSFFTANIRNKNTRRAYYKAVCRFSDWITGRGLKELELVKPVHVAAYIEWLLDKEKGAGLSKPTVKQHLAALRMLFDWLVVGQVIAVNPAHAVRGPRYSQKKGKTPVLTAEEARTLLDSIRVTRIIKEEGGREKVVPCPVGLRDRALIGLMVFTFARVGAALGMKVADFFVQGRRGWVRLHEKGSKQHDIPANHNLDAYLEAYIKGVGLDTEPNGLLFRSAEWRPGGGLTGKPMRQADVYRMIRRRALAAGIKTKIGCHTFRATGITAYLKNGGRLEVAQHLAAHESARTTGLYDRRGDEVSLDEVERIGI